MNYPLYKDHGAPERPAHNSMHMGLWFERFFNGYQSDFADVSKEQRTAWLSAFRIPKLGRSEALKTKAERIRQLAASQGGQTRIYHCTGSFVTGLGNPHPIENGFTWHPTLGLPYLPGSAVKGLVRAVVETAYKGEDKAEVLTRWFGSEEKGDVAERSGCLIFLDALPTAPCALVPEIMTPHMGKWYENGGKATHDKTNLPGDWHSPVPVSYLTAQDLKLQFAILPRVQQATAEDVDAIWQALDYGLKWLGAGAKTAQGFGLMQVDKLAERELQQAQEEAAKEQRMANLSASMRKIEEFVNELRTQHEAYPTFKEGPNRNYHNKARELAKVAHEGQDWSTDEKRAAAEAIETWLPKLVSVDMKDERKKLKLNSLKGL